MPKGTRNEPNIDYAIAELFGGIRQQIIYFSAEVGVGADWVASRLATLLQPQRQGVYDQLPAVQHAATGLRGVMEPLALAEHAHSSQAPVVIEARRKPGGSKDYWAKMTKEQRAAEMLRRMKKSKSKDPRVAAFLRSATKKKTKPTGGKAKKRGRPPGKAKDSKQAVYQARYYAKLKGEPLPPLPPT